MYETQYFSPVAPYPAAVYPAEGVFMPRTDILESPAEFLYVFEFPGADPAGIQVELQNRELRVAAAVGLSGTEQYIYRYQERPHGRLERTIAFSDNVSGENITAESRHGLLLVHVPKRAGTAATGPHRIPVNPGTGTGMNPPATGQLPGTGQGLPS